MARIEGSEVQSQICEAFGIKPEQLTPSQIFLLVRIAKHCRLRCRSNAALNNWLKKGFPALKITTVEMQSKFRYNEVYNALRISNPLQVDKIEETEPEEVEG